MLGQTAERGTEPLEVRDRRGLGAQCASVRASRSARESPEHPGRVCEWRCVLAASNPASRLSFWRRSALAQLQRERCLLSTRARRSAAWTDRSVSNSSTNVPGLGSLVSMSYRRCVDVSGPAAGRAQCSSTVHRTARRPGSPRYALASPPRVVRATERAAAPFRRPGQPRWAAGAAASQPASQPVAAAAAKVAAGQPGGCRGGRDRLPRASQVAAASQPGGCRGVKIGSQGGCRGPATWAERF